MNQENPDVVHGDDPTLIIQDGYGVNREFVINRSMSVIGREADCDITIRDLSVIATAIAFLGPLAPSWTTATIIFALLWAYQLAWTLLIFLLGWTFNAARCAAHATRTFRLANTVIGIAASPFLLSALFAPPSLRPILLVAAAITAATCILVKYIKLITILFTHKISIFYMILYFCALEILPVIVLYKLWE